MINNKTFAVYHISTSSVFLSLPQVRLFRSSQRYSPAIMAESDWQDHKLEIARLYLEENKPLKEVMQIMLEIYGFYKTYTRPFAVPYSYCNH